MNFYDFGFGIEVVVWDTSTGQEVKIINLEEENGE